MHHLILGYGYCGYFLAQELLQNHQQVTVVSRQLNPAFSIPGIKHVAHDLSTPFEWDEPDTVLHYLIPPPAQGDKDTLLKNVLDHSKIKAKKMIYFGSSGVYGDHQGAWVDEQSECNITTPRQRRRIDAEQQCLAYSQKLGIQCILLRIAGIYGPGRLPIEAAKARTPLIDPEQAAATNHIYVRDLATIAFQLSQINVTDQLFSIADGDPKPMGSLQQMVARSLKINEAPYETWAQVFEGASPMKKEFMQASKKLSIQRLKNNLAPELPITNLSDELVEQLLKEGGI